MRTITVNSSKSYDILLGKGLLNSSGEFIRKLTKAEKAVIVTDDNVDKLYSETVTASLVKSGFSAAKFVFQHGESSKSHEVLTKLYSFLVEKDISRTDIIIALGGGVVGDLTGFCAATYLRGVDFVQLPTTLLAQVDSSVGGKTAVNIPAGKNLIGAFYQPILVIADTDTLLTLSDDIFADGMGEVVKYGMIKSKSLFDLISKKNAAENLDDIIAECISIKKNVVEIDEFDTGERMTLNFGHTFGHSIEKLNNYSGISHGKAVAIGMYYITQFAEKNGMCEKGTSEKLKLCLSVNRLPFCTDITNEQLFALSFNDKKRTSSAIRIVICPKIGESEIVTLSLENYRKFLEIK